MVSRGRPGVRGGAARNLRRGAQGWGIDENWRFGRGVWRLANTFLAGASLLLTLVAGPSGHRLPFIVRRRSSFVFRRHRWENDRCYFRHPSSNVKIPGFGALRTRWRGGPGVSLASFVSPSPVDAPDVRQNLCDETDVCPGASTFGRVSGTSHIGPDVDGIPPRAEAATLKRRVNPTERRHPNFGR